MKQFPDATEPADADGILIFYVIVPPPVFSIVDDEPMSDWRALLNHHIMQALATPHAFQNRAEPEDSFAFVIDLSDPSFAFFHDWLEDNM